MKSIRSTYVLYIHDCVKLERWLQTQAKVAMSRISKSSVAESVVQGKYDQGMKMTRALS